MNSSVLLVAFLCLAVIAAIDVMRRSIDGFFMERRNAELKRVMRKLTKKNQPRITVLVMGENEATSKSLKRLRYTVFDVVTFERRHTQTEAQAYRSAYRKSKRGEIVVCLRSGEVVDPYFLKRVIVNRKQRDKWCVEALWPFTDKGILGIALGLQSALWGNKISIEVYEAKLFQKVQKPAWRFQGTTLWVWSLIATGIILGSIVFGLEALWYSWILFVAYLLCVVWIQQGSSLSERLSRSFAAPSALFFMPVSSLFQGVLQLSARK